MDEAIIYIGLGQSVFAAILMFLKKPLNIADKILGSWLLVIASMFVVNIVKRQYQIDEGTWPISVNLVITFPTFLYLYSKYITKEHDKFNRKDLLHFIPLVIGLLTIIFFFDFKISDINSFAKHYRDLLTPRIIVGNLFLLCLWLYIIFASITVYKYKKKISDFYSYDSYKINLSWLLVLIISFFLTYNFIIIISSFHLGKSFINEIEIFRSGALLIFVYILSFWGYKQQQLISDNKPIIRLNNSLASQETTTGKYTKSGLKDDQASEYMQKLIESMEQNEFWKDNELSVAKLSQHTNISKHYITQVLNENIQKNFSTFVNEYRIEYAMQLIKSPKYTDWSLLAIAYECGFNSKTAFNNFFKKYTGMTPSDFRNNSKS